MQEFPIEETTTPQERNDGTETDHPTEGQR
jgi:hypothetical protein